MPATCRQRLGTRRMAGIDSKRRRLFLSITGSALLGASTAAPAQPQRRVQRVGILLESEPSPYMRRIDSFKAGMTALGYVEGRDYLLELRSARSDFARLPEMAAELAASKIAVIVTSSTSTAVAASKA